MRGVSVYHRVAEHNRKQAQIKEQCDKIIEALGRTGAPQRCVAVVAKRLVLNSPYLYDGNTLCVKARSLGLGVYEMSLEK